MASLYHNTISKGYRGNKRNNKRKTDQPTYAQPSKISNQSGYIPFTNNATFGLGQMRHPGGMLNSSYFVSQDRQKPYVFEP